LTAKTAPDLRNPVLDRMRADEAALGMLVRLGRCGDVARIAKSTGHDFVFIDDQHGIFNLETIAHIASTALEIGVAPVVRVRGVDDPDVSMLPDNGVTGIVFPDVNDADTARRAVRTCRFPPHGRRSVGGAMPQFDYRAIPTDELVTMLDATTLVVCMIETVEALNNVEAIATVDGVDVVHVGSNDLLLDMGKPGQFDHPDLISAQQRVIEAAKKHGKFSGCGGNRNVERQAEVIGRGVRFVTTQTDVAFIISAGRQWVDGVRGQASKE
jgi:2-keto-3-deoxy-L-rhamnonate aldolase RhmA